MNRMMKNILNGLDTCIYVSSMDTDELLFVNNRLKEAFKLDENVVGKICWKALMGPDAGRCVFCPVDELAVTPNTSIVWERHNKITGRYYKHVDSVIEWLNGELVHLKSFDDITELYMTQQEIREVKERLEMALTASEAAVWEFDYASSQFTYDRLCGEFFRFTDAPGTISIEALDTHLKNVMAKGEAPKLFDALRGSDIFAGGSALVSKLVFKNGDTRYVRSYGATQMDTNGKPLRMVGMNMDITQDVNMENALKAAKQDMEAQAKVALAASEAKSQFLSNMSHEIRTPMNAIIGMSDLLANEQLNERQMTYVNDIRISSTALLGIINDILDFSKIEAGKMQLAPVDYNIVELLENVGSMFSFAAQKKGISFDMDIHRRLPPCLYGDDIRMRQILVNVLGNAIKFTDKGGITLTIDISGDMLCFEIADTGIGMREGDLPKVFTEFNRLDIGVNRNITGTGLGLSITKRLVSLMGGNIQVDSIYGKGTVFHIPVPLVPGNLEKLKEARKEWRPVYAPEANILVVDDNEINLNVAAGLLRLCGITCDTAPSGAQAIRKAKGKKYDIVFMDHMMPEMDGVEATRRLRERFSPGELVIVALTANAVGDIRETLLQNGMNDFISKPIDKNNLTRILEKWLPKDKLLPSAGLPVPQGGDTLSPLLCEVSAIEEIDVQLGLEQIGGLQDAYEKSLHILANRLPGIAERLQGSLADGDLWGCAIEVHGLKGSMGNIGAMALAQKAGVLEKYAKENDEAHCREHLPEFCASLLDLAGRLGGVLAAAAGAKEKKPAGNKEHPIHKMTVVRDLIDEFEGDRAMEIVKERMVFDYGGKTNEALQGIVHLLEMFEFEKAIEAINTQLGGDEHG